MNGILNVFNKLQCVSLKLYVITFVKQNIIEVLEDSTNQKNNKTFCICA